MVKPKLTVKELKYIHARAQGKNQTEAGLIAGAKTVAGARQYALRTHKKPEVRDQLQKALKRHGLTIDNVLKPIAEALEAKRVYGSKKSGLVESDLPEHSTRLKAASMAGDLLGIKAEVTTSIPYDKQAIKQALESGDELELREAVWRKVDNKDTKA